MYGNYLVIGREEYYSLVIVCGNKSFKMSEKGNKRQAQYFLGQCYVQTVHSSSELSQVKKKSGKSHSGKSQGFLLVDLGHGNSKFLVKAWEFYFKVAAGNECC